MKCVIGCWRILIQPINSSHPDAQGGRTGDTKDATPQQTQLAVQQARLISLQSALQTLASRRVFITGGGYAPGQDGVSI
jgi:hypothetical protein